MLTIITYDDTYKDVAGREDLLVQAVVALDMGPSEIDSSALKSDNSRLVVQGIFAVTGKCGIGYG